jgi:isoleucyl-tRNA synthetase
VLGSLDGFSDDERVPVAEMPELERWVLHRLAEISGKFAASVESYDWTGVYPELHNFCAVDLSAFYFDIRKDALYCDRPDSLRRRAARTVLDQLHRYLCTWLAPVLCFTAEEAWCARFGDDTSVHLEQFQTPPADWRDDALAAKWETIRAIRRRITVPIEDLRKTNAIGSSLQAAVELPLNAANETLLDEAAWAEIAIVSSVTLVSDTDESPARVTPASGEKCVRCWRVLPEVGSNLDHPALCLRCADAVDSGLVCKKVQ